MNIEQSMGITDDKAHVSPRASSEKAAPTAAGVTARRVSIRATSDALFALLYLPPVPKLDPVTRFAQPINLNAFTPQERKWIEEAQAEEEGRT